MVFVGIDVAKDKHDCFIANSAGEILSPLPIIFMGSMTFNRNINP